MAAMAASAYGYTGRTRGGGDTTTAASRLVVR